LYKRQQQLFAYRIDEDAEHWANRWLFRIAHEAHFVLAAAAGIALPFFSADFAGTFPLWWAVEAAILLAVSWRSREELKHAVAGVAAVGSLFVVFQPAAPFFVSLLVPAILVGIALAYRFYGAGLSNNLRLFGYGAYLYVTVVACGLMAVIHLGLAGALPVLVFEFAVVIALLFWLRDFGLFVLGTFIVGPAALFLFGWSFHAQSLTWFSLIEMVVAAYSASFLYHFIREKYMVPKDVSGYGYYGRDTKRVPVFPVHKFLADVQNYIVVDEHAVILEWVYGVVGFLALVAGSWQLLSGASITIAWAVAAVLLTVLGVVSGKLPHRASAWIAAALCAIKAMSLDLIMNAGADRALSFGAAGICFLVVVGVYTATQKKPQQPASQPALNGDGPPPAAAGEGATPAG
jgi:hypothetical protein